MTIVDPKTGEPWVPAFKGQRPPFQPGNELGATVGNELAIKHGASSPKRVDPLATTFRDEILAVPHMRFLNEPQNATIFWAWCRQAARVQLLEDYCDSMTMQEAADGSRGTTPPLELLRKHTATLLTLTSRLGLDPLSYAKLHKDAAQAGQADAATMLTQARLQAEGKAQGHT